MFKVVALVERQAIGMFDSESGLSHRRLRRGKVMKPSTNDNSSQLIEFSGRCIVEKRICPGAAFIVVQR